MDHLLFIGSNVFAFLASWFMARLLVPRATAGERALLVAAGLPVVVLLPLKALGAVGALNANAATATVVLLAVGLGGLAWRRRDQVERIQSEPLRPHELAVVGALAALCVLLATDLGVGHLVHTFRYHWDDYSYHGPMPAHWIQRGDLGLSPYNYHAYYPGNGELFAAWFLLPSSYLSYAALAGVFWFVLAALAAFQLARNLGSSVYGALAAVLVLLVSKPFDGQAGSFAAVDLGAAALAASAIALACAPARAATDATDATTISRGRLLYVGVLMGLAIGCKVTYAPIAVVTFLWLLWDRRVALARIPSALLTLGLACVAGGFVWYLRNWIITGNPLFPADILFFEGPLDAAARERTTLLFQWNEKLDDAGRDRALKQLLKWPPVVAYGVVAGYGLSLLAALWPGAWKDPVGRRRLLLCIGGLLMLAVIVAGPFSGTANAKFAKLQIRLRFSLPVVLLGIPMLIHWLEQARPLRVGLSVAVAAAAVIVAGAPVGLVAMATAVGLALGLAAPQVRERVPAWAGGALAFALLVGCATAADRAMVAKQPRREALQRKEVKAWNVLDHVPTGARVTWFSTFDRYKYLRAFGPRLQLTPVPVHPDGSEYIFLHDYWREYRPTWWDQKDRPETLRKLVANLMEQRVDYVVVMKRHKGGWPLQYDRLKRSNSAVEVVREKSVVLYKIEREKK